MSEDRIRSAFGDLGRQAREADPAPGLARLRRDQGGPDRPTPRWLAALAAAVVVIAAIGTIVLLARGPGGDEVAAPTDQTTATTAPTVATTDGRVGGEVTDTTGASTDVTTPPLETTTTTDPFEGRQPVFASEGWRVVGVESDDVLNVRSGPGTEFEIVGTYPPDSELVTLNGLGSTDGEGQGWWGVTLLGEVQGFVNRQFLAPPVSWVGDMPESACGLEETPDFGQDGTEEVDVSDQPNTVFGLAHVDGEDCDRYIIVLGDTDLETLAARPVASFNATGTDVVSLGDEVIVYLPPWLTEVAQTATIDRFGATMAVVGTPEPPVEEAPLQVRLLGAHDDAVLSYRANPARIIVDLLGTDDAAAPSFIVGEGVTVLTRPPVVNGENAQVEISGFARWFEAQGVVQITAADGSSVNPEFSGMSLTGVLGEGFAGVYAPWWPGYGAFRVFVDGLPSGTYDLFVGDDCYVGGEGDASEPCGVDTTFVIP